jgi:4-hydroxy-tetrahydrodipicolinate reductase
MGGGMAKMLLGKQGIELVGVCDRNPNNIDRDIYDCLGIDRQGRPPLIIRHDPNLVLYEKCCDVLLLATDSFVKNAFDRIKFCLELNLNVITIAEEMAYPMAQSPELADRLDQIAKEHGVSVLGTGINPGFVLDYLILALTGTCEQVNAIYAKRINDLSPFGQAVMHEQGVGITQDEYDKRMHVGELAGHVGFPESIQMIADGLGVELERIEQTKEPILSKTYRETSVVSVEPECLAGLRQRGFGYVNNRLFIEMDHPQQILPHLEGTKTGDFIQISGVPNISLQITPEIPGGIGTISMAVNMIPHVINAPPGLKTMLDMPVPRALMGDVRQMIANPLID